MAAKTKFEVYKDNKGNFRWKLLAANGEPVASSGEGFPEKRTAMNAVKKLKDWSNTENIVDVEKMKEEAKKMADKKKMETAKSKTSITKKTVKTVKKAVNTVKKVVADATPVL